jgi:perosamine synthetase
MAEPDVGSKEREYMNEAFDSGWISSKGPFISRFENEFAKFSGTRYAVSCSNGTTALHLAVRALGIGEGDEVIIPNLTFASPANAVMYERGRPVLVDVERNYWCIDPDRVKESITEKTKAIIVVHLYGHPADMDQIMNIAKEYNLRVIEDCAEAHGAAYKGRKVGSIGDIGCFSFYGNKIITTGEGGMITTNDQELAEKIRILRDHGMQPSRRYWHDEVGYNYRMTNIQAAIGLAQMESIEDKIRKRKWIARKYSEYIGDSAALQPEMPWASNVYWLPTFMLNGLPDGESRDSLMALLSKEGVESRPVFYPLNEMPPYVNEKQFPNSNYVSYHGISLPVSNRFDDEDIRFISDVFSASVSKIRQQ